MGGCSSSKNAGSPALTYHIAGSSRLQLANVMVDALQPSVFFGAFRATFLVSVCERCSFLHTFGLEVP